MNACLPWQKQNSDFHILAFPIGYVGGLRCQWGLKTNFKFFLKGIFVQERSSGTRFDHGQFEIKIFPIYAQPYSPRLANSPFDPMAMRFEHAPQKCWFCSLLLHFSKPNLTICDIFAKQEGIIKLLVSFCSWMNALLGLQIRTS